MTARHLGARSCYLLSPASSSHKVTRRFGRDTQTGEQSLKKAVITASRWRCCFCTVLYGTVRYCYCTATVLLNISVEIRYTRDPPPFTSLVSSWRLGTRWSSSRRLRSTDKCMSKSDAATCAGANQARGGPGSSWSHADEVQGQHESSGEGRWKKSPCDGVGQLLRGQWDPHMVRPSRSTPNTNPRLIPPCQLPRPWRKFYEVTFSARFWLANFLPFVLSFLANTVLLLLQVNANEDEMERWDAALEHRATQGSLWGWTNVQSLQQSATTYNNTTARVYEWRSCSKKCAGSCPVGQRRRNLYRLRLGMASRPSGAPICSCNQADHGCHTKKQFLPSSNCMCAAKIKPRRAPVWPLLASAKVSDLSECLPSIHPRQIAILQHFPFLLTAKTSSKM